MFGWYQNCFYLCTRFSEVKYSGCSALGAGGRGFESRYPDRRELRSYGKM